MADDVGVARRDPHFPKGYTSPTLAVAVPALVGAATDPLLSLIDTAFVGRLPNDPTASLAALGACTSVFHLAFSTFRASTAATTSLVAEALARNADDEEAGEAAARSVAEASARFGLLAGGIVGATLLLLARPILAAMGVPYDPTPGSLYARASSYLRIRATSAPLVLLGMASEGAFRGRSNTVVPLLASAAAAATNAVLDPLLMFGGVARWGVGGAAAATAIAQLASTAVYARCSPNRRATPERRRETSAGVDDDGDADAAVRSSDVWRSLLHANATMMLKQGSLLLAWACAASRAARLGTSHAAAHQVALSVWLLAALVQDGPAVSAQVLMSRVYHDDHASDDVGVNGKEERDEHLSSLNADDERRRRRWFDPRHARLVRYMVVLALCQGLVFRRLLRVFGGPLASAVTDDPSVRFHLADDGGGLLREVARQQPLVSATLVVEGLVVGGDAVGRTVLATGTALSALASAAVLRRATDATDLWRCGVVCLFAGRLAAAILGTLSLLWRGGRRSSRAKRVERGVEG